MTEIISKRLEVNQECTNKSNYKLCYEVPEIDCLINEIKSIDSLPDVKILLVVVDREYVSNNKPEEATLGEATSKEIYLKYNPRLTGYIDYCNVTDWEYAILISNKLWEMRNEYPAYFTYLLGHELGHVIIMSTDKDFHILSCITYDYLGNCNKNIKNYELAFEEACDEFGKYVSELIHSKDKLNDELEKLITSDNVKNFGRLKNLMKLSGTEAIDTNKVKNDLIKFCQPYRDCLITVWKKEKVRSIEYNLNKIVEEVDDFEKLLPKLSN
jgi:hypothetical protein